MMKNKVIKILIMTSFLFSSIAFSKEKSLLCNYEYRLKTKSNKEIGKIYYTIKEGKYEGEECYEILGEDGTRIKWLFIKVKMNGKERVYISKEKGLLYFERTETMSADFPPDSEMTTRIIGKRDGERMLMEKVTVDTVYMKNGKKGKKEDIANWEIDLRGITLRYELELPIISQILKPTIGEKKKFKVFDHETQEVIEEEIEVIGKERIKIAGKEWESYIIKCKIDKDITTAWISDDAKIMLKREDRDGKMELYKFDKN